MRRFVAIMGFLLSFGAVALQFAVMVPVDPDPGAAAIRFFSYFTILSNLSVALFFVSELFRSTAILGRLALRWRLDSAVFVYMIVVALVYNLMLRATWHPVGWGRVADELLHVVVPLFVMLYWFVFCAGRQAVSGKVGGFLLVWQIFPILYLGYSLVRGVVSAWYPYPFMDAGRLGWWRISITVLILTALFLLLSRMILFIDAFLAKKRGGAPSQ